jgi:hypothetical protein
MISKKIALAGAAALLTSCGNHFKFDGVKYRTNSKTEATLAAIGHKDGGFLGLLPESFKAWGQYPISNVPVRVNKPQKIETVSKKKIEAELKEQGIPEAEISAKVESIYNNISSGRYRLITFLQEDVLPIVNDTSTQRAKARRTTLGTKKARVVSSVIVVYDHSEKAERVFAGEAVVKVTSVADGSIKFLKENGETVTLSDGSVYAYELSYPQYTGDQISRLKVDRIGLDGRH